MRWANIQAPPRRAIRKSFWNDGTSSLPWKREDPLLAQEIDFRVELLRSETEMEQAFRLRHLLFAETLGWVPECPQGRETDDYDATTEMIAVLDPSRRVLGQVRVHESTTPYMMEREFASVLGSNLLPFKGLDTAELTRFGVHPEARSLVVQTGYGPFDLFTLLLKGVYQWSLRHGVGTLFAVTDRRVFRLLHLRGFPFEAMAEPRLMPDGVTAVAIRLDWGRFEEQNQDRRPGLLAWFRDGHDAALEASMAFREVPGGPASRRWPQPGGGSRHRAS